MNPTPASCVTAGRAAALDDLTEGLERAVGHLRSLQQPDGHYIAELEANVTLTAEYVFLGHMLDRHDPGRERRAVAEIIAQQAADGGYVLHEGGPGDLSATVEAYVAMRIAGEAVHAPHMERARDFIVARGGVEASRVFTRQYLAMLGLWDYAGTPALPAWLILLPDRFAMSIYQMSSWARSCVVPLLVLMSLRPVFPPRVPVTIDEICTRPDGPQRHRTPLRRDAWFSVHNAFVMIDRGLKVLQRLGWSPGQERALRRAEEWILRHQDDEGDWGGILPAMAFSMLALKALGYERGHDAMDRGWRALERFAIDDGSRRRLQSCVSPVWDTGLALWSLQEAGVAPDDSALVRGAQWLLQRQVRHYGDWSVKNRAGRPGGWAFEYHNRFYPDNDDTAVVILALRGIDLGPDGPCRDAAIRAAEAWVRSMQCRPGGWGAFDVDNDQTLWNRVPFADHGAMLDPNTPDLTGHVIEMLGALGHGVTDPAVDSAIRYLRGEQRPDGAWFGRWGVNYVYGTSAALAGLARVGLPEADPMVRRAARFLIGAQNADGGWGEACESYDVGHFVARASTASQTAWALIGLVAAGEARSEPAQGAVRWLLQHQRPEGGWDEAAFTGTGFPSHFYIRYHLYRDCFPTLALGLYRQGVSRGEG